MNPTCDDAVWLSNGLPGIVIGIGHGKVSILWSNLNVSKHSLTEIVWLEKFLLTINPA